MCILEPIHSAANADTFLRWYINWLGSCVKLQKGEREEGWRVHTFGKRKKTYPQSNSLQNVAYYLRPAQRVLLKGAQSSCDESLKTDLCLVLPGMRWPGRRMDNNKQNTRRSEYFGVLQHCSIKLFPKLVRFFFFLAWQRPVTTTQDKHVSSFNQIRMSFWWCAYSIQESTDRWMFVSSSSPFPCRLYSFCKLSTAFCFCKSRTMQVGRNCENGGERDFGHVLNSCRRHFS